MSQAGKPFSGLRLKELQRKLRDKTEWAVAKVGPLFAAGGSSLVCTLPL